MSSYTVRKAHASIPSYLYGFPLTLAAGFYFLHRVNALGQRMGLVIGRLWFHYWDLYSTMCLYRTSDWQDGVPLLGSVLYYVPVSD